MHPVITYDILSAVGKVQIFYAQAARELLCLNTADSQHGAQYSTDKFVDCVELDDKLSRPPG